MLYPKIRSVITALRTDSIDAKRIPALQQLAAYIQERRNDGKTIRLNFICTHNSRRSHLAQIWAQTLSHYFGITNVECYSGGTAVTAVYPVIAETLKTTGFNIRTISDSGSNNPVYSIKYGANEMPVVGFSKTYDHQFNPAADFAAILTCSHADKNCPVIPNANLRLALPYEDPKEYDNSPLQTAKYRERSEQIATEMYYVFSAIK